jgi:hypothetical protein
MCENKQSMVIPYETTIATYNVPSNQQGQYVSFLPSVLTFWQVFDPSHDSQSSSQAHSLVVPSAQPPQVPGSGATQQHFPLFTSTGLSVPLD